MSKFKFRFQSVQRVKEIFEKRIEEEISRLNQQIAEQKIQLRKTTDERNRLAESMIKEPAKVADYQSMKSYDVQLEKEIISIQKKISALLKKREEKQKELLEKKKEVKAFETLKENAYEDFLVEDRRDELKILNEVAVRNHKGDQP